MTDPRELALDLYAAVLEGSSLQSQVATIARSLHAEMGFITRIGVRNGQPNGAGEFTSVGFDEEVLRDYAENWLQHDPRVLVGARQPPGVLNFNRLCPPHELARSMFWNEFGQHRAPGFHSLTATVTEPDDVLGVLAFNRRRHEEPFGAEEEAVMQALYPHLRQALLAESRLRLMGTRVASVEAGLDALPQGIAVVGEEGRLLHANAALQAMAARRDGFSLGAAGLEIADSGAAANYRYAVRLALAVTTGRIRLLPEGMHLAVPRPSGGAPWLVQLLPLRRGGAGALGAFAGAVAVVTDAEARRPPSALLLQRLLDLSAAEADLAAGLAAGKDLATLAQRRGVSRETLRTHLAAIRRKTGCRRQAELVALVLRLSG